MTNETESAESPLRYEKVGGIRGIFSVPAYQRGYRWDAFDVERLLDDIWRSEGKPYSLQPVVVKLSRRRENGEDDEWELIDGQQRLTTLYLIFLYMQKQGWRKPGPPYSIHYKTRPGSQEYLKTIDPAKHDSNIDYYHLYKAYEYIDHWFKNHGDDNAQQHAVNKFSGYLFDSVSIIWYEAPAEENSISLFTRLNVGRIPLTDAELVKALLLSHMRKSHGEPRAQEIAAQWDGIERDLQKPEIWAFVAGADSQDDPDKYPTRISLLLDTLADSIDPPKAGEKRPRYRTFDVLHGKMEGLESKFWEDDVVWLHALVLGWFDEPDLYNKIGFLVAAGATLGEVMEWARSRKKNCFRDLLIEQIRNTLKLHESRLSELRYDPDYSTFRKVLLLMNIETVSRTGQHFPFHRHVGKAWSLEHIHAQNAEGLTKVEQWKAWLESHRKALRALSDQHPLLQEIDEALQRIDTERNFGSKFKELAPRVMGELSASAVGEAPALNYDMHSISNMALLPSDINSLLSNSVFEVKRQLILEIDRNQDGKTYGYIPICTRNVFLKYYADADAQQIHFWSIQDRESYLNAIISTIKKYFTLESYTEEPTK